MLPVNEGPVLGSTTLGSKYLNPSWLFNQGYEFFHELFIYMGTESFRNLFITSLFFFSLFFVTVISYCIVRLFEIRKKEHAHLHHEIMEYKHRQEELARKKQEGGESVSKNERWNRVLTYLFSSSSSDWKLAVIEADAMLEGLMDSMGFKGENLAEKLKAANQTELRGIGNAWEVHNIRNRIAHEGLSFELSQHEAKRVIALYEQIFRQFGYI